MVREAEKVPSFSLMRGKGALSGIPRGHRGDRLAFLRTAVA